MSEHYKQSDWTKWLVQDFATPNNIKENQKSILNDNQENLEKVIEKKTIEAQKKGFESGYKSGKNSGYLKGLEEGKREGLLQFNNQQIEKKIKIDNLIKELKSSILGLDAVIPSRIIQIALQISEKIIKTSPVCNTKMLIKDIQKLLHEKNFLGEDLRLYVHPDDLNLLQEYLGDTFKNQGWRILGDGQLLRGGFRILSEDGEIDATLESKWNHICQTLKKDNIQ
ncbi:MAG: FliH family flagellar assembly protein [Wigglesworthia glossinidia]|nr:FliH family flagellar assembly protein [Wigglesworthia glossinidia]